MKGQGGAALKGILLLINRRQGPRPLLHDLLLMNLPLVKRLMDVAHAVCRGDITFANAQTLLLFLGMIAVGGLESIFLVVHRERLKIGNALQPALALRGWLMWFWTPIPFCRTLWKFKTIGWTLNFIRMVRALFISPWLASRGQGLLMVDVSVALRRGIRLATAPIAGMWQKTSAVVDMGKVQRVVHKPLPKTKNAR
jgi:hypothetical protein